MSRVVSVRVGAVFFSVVVSLDVFDIEINLFNKSSCVHAFPLFTVNRELLEVLGRLIEDHIFHCLVVYQVFMGQFYAGAF